MKVLYIHQYFKIPEEGGSVRSYYLASGLVRKGMEVEMITAHNKPTYQEINIEGIKVHYLPVFYENGFSFKQRILGFFKFARLAFIKALSIKNVDICYVMTTPLTTGLVALGLKWFKKKPYIFEVGDLWPQVPADMGVIKNRFFKSILYWFEKLCYEQSIGVVALSSGIADYIKTKVPDKQIEIIPNIADTAFFSPEEKKPELLEKYGIRNHFVISYTGTLGVANHLEYLLDAAGSAVGLNVKFLIIGDGAEKEKLQEIASNRKLSNVVFLPAGNKQKAQEILNISDAVYISFLNVDSLHTGSPNKLFDGLASGKLIITNLCGWIKGLIHTNDAGFSYKPEDTKAFVENLLLFINNKELLRSFQKNARRLAENSFSLEMLSERQEELIRVNK
ncbi:MAG: glycosyltransferase family 4 protein [Cyclobacteriaceae bacterium]